ncbi:MAG: helix-turn-helix transcriptional regulator [Spirosomataceae bacterium]
MNTTEKRPHQGHNVKRIREMLGVKQDYLAASLGISQQAISQLEQKETLDASTLEKLAKILNISEEAIKNFSEETAINIVSNNYHDQSASVQYNFNPIDKIVELYERLLQVEKEKNELLQQLLNKQ